MFPSSNTGTEVVTTSKAVKSVQESKPVCMRTQRSRLDSEALTYEDKEQVFTLQRIQLKVNEKDKIYLHDKI